MFNSSLLGIVLVLIIIIIVYKCWYAKSNSSQTTERAQGAAWKYSTDLSRRVPMRDGGFLNGEAKENWKFVRGGTTFFPKSTDRRPSSNRVTNPTIPKPPPAMATPEPVPVPVPATATLELPDSTTKVDMDPNAAPGEFERFY